VFTVIYILKLPIQKVDLLILISYICLGYQDEQDSGVLRPRGAMTQNSSIEIPDDDEDDDDGLECGNYLGNIFIKKSLI
jgi:hypothetical protein